MRLSTEVLNDIIPNFLRDGWQVVSPVAFDPRFFYIHVNLDLISEHSRYRRSGERDHPGRVRECSKRHKRHRPAPATRARPNHEEERYGPARKARR